MKILLLGGAGQLGREVLSRAEALNFSILSPVKSELSITDRDALVQLAQKASPEVIINTAAYTAVDKAEEEKELCFAINRDGAANVAAAAKAVSAKLIHLSTDYVFSGEGTMPFREDDPVAPQSVYGASKEEGERAIFEILDGNAIVLRVSSLHGQYGHNFVHTMLKLFEERELVRVVGDQIMSPTWAGWLADTILDVARVECSGIYHACSGGEISWFEFAEKIYQLANAPEAGWKARLESVPSTEYVTAAKRPQYSVMNTDKLTQLLGRAPLSWEQGLTNHLKDIGRLAVTS